MGRPAVFLDRDGVLIRDVDFLTRREQVEVAAGAPAALQRLRRAGFALVVVTNQPVVARGLLTEDEVRALQVFIEKRLRESGGGDLDGFYFCPHHPSADLVSYRAACECRKPRPGMLRRAGRELEIDVSKSFMIGDRPSDVEAGRRAGCRTVLVQTGRHAAAPIQSPDGPFDPVPDHVCADLATAVDWVLEDQGR